jgi:uncharacterized protein (TIGR00159 family)
VIGVSVLFAVYAAARAFDLRLLTQILQTLAVVGLFALVVVFQPELRRALERVGRVGSFYWLFSSTEARTIVHVADEVSRAASLLSADGHGALIVLERETGLEEVAETGVMIHADVSADLLRTIFAPRTPLHDGAVIIRDETIIAAGALLPLAEMTVHTERFGTRHRAALGITEQTDAVGDRRLRGEQPGQPGRTGPDRPEPQPAAAREGRPVAARAGSGARPDRAAPARRARRACAAADRLRAVRRPEPVERCQARPGRGSGDGCTGAAVTRLVGLVVHNWPLKVMAIALAFLLYAGLVVSQSQFEYPSPVPIRIVNQPENAVVLGNLPPVTRIRYIVNGDVGAGPTPDTWLATVDLAGVNPNAGSSYQTVHVTSLDPRFIVIDYEPRAVTVQLDPYATYTVPVTVKTSPPPPDVKVGQPELSQSTVTVSGPDSVVKYVVAAQADVAIDPHGLSVDRDVPLIPIDNQGNELRPVKVEPNTVNVKIDVISNAQSKSVAVHPSVVGTPPAGYQIGQVTVDPSLVTVEGSPAALSALTTADTEPIPVGTATGRIDTRRSWRCRRASWPST